MNINNIFQKSLSEDTVEYFLYLNVDTSAITIDEIRVKCLALATKIIGGYIWNFEGFGLSIKSNTDNIPCHLYGLTNFGDFIEDEWFCVYLLLEISKNVPEIVCQIQDNDGEFLLIEAAEHLPKWLTPKTAYNRVFIHQGVVHIIPKIKDDSKLPGVDFSKEIDLQTALSTVRHNPWLTQAHANVLAAIDRRTLQFRNNTNKNIQHVNVFIPRPLAAILDVNQNFISHAVRSFYYRDQLELRSCRVFKKFKPSDRIWCQIAMNRCSYAQLMQQTFIPDKRSGYVVDKHLGMRFKGHDLGCKIAHGFEMLYHRYRHDESTKNNEIDEVYFARYIESLTSLDYFKGEIEGSILYKRLFNEARLFYEQNMNHSNQDEDQNIVESVAYRIHKLYKSIGEDYQFNLVKTSDSHEGLPTESNDKWMYLNEGEVDNLVSDMNEGFAKMNKNNVNTATPTDVENLENLSTRMKNFVSTLSDYEGIENDNVNFDFDEFSSALEGMLNGKTLEEVDSDEFLSTSEEESDSSDEEITSYMEQMDSEISQTKIGESFIKDNSDDKPVDIDVNLVQNFLESHSSSMGLHGPTNSLLNSIGIKLPSNADV